MNWLAAFMYIRSYRITQNGKVKPIGIQDVDITTNERYYIPFMIIALKIIHEIHCTKQNELQYFEAYLAEKLDCLGPLDALLELSTRCRENQWSEESHGFLHSGKVIGREVIMM